MTDEKQEEIERLRAELESYRQREVQELRTALATAREDIAALRQECQRLSTQGYAVAQEAQRQIAELRAKLDQQRFGATREQISRGVKA